MIRSGHVDTFARDNLPPQTQWPEFKFTLPELQYPERLNCVTEFVDRWVANEGDRIAIISPAETLTYAQLAERINRIANVLTRDLGMVPGNRVLMRAPNSAMAIAVYLAVIKAGGVMVATMPLLRAKELSYVVTKAKIKLALCDARLSDEMEKTKPLARELTRIVYWGNGDLEALMAQARLRELHRLRHGERRRLPHRLHLRHDRRAEGHDAFPARHAGELRQLRANTCCSRTATTASSARRRSPSRSGSAGTCCSRSASARPRSSSRRRRRTCCSRRSRNTAPRSASRRRPPIGR